MVIIYEDSNKAVRALYALRESKYEDKHLLGIHDIYFYIAFIFDDKLDAYVAIHIKRNINSII